MPLFLCSIFEWQFRRTWLKVKPNRVSRRTACPGTKAMRLCYILSLLLLLMPGGNALAAEKPSKPQVVRIGYFPNVTHAQALVARHLSRQGKGWFEQRLGPNVEIRWFTYNAGPSAMEAIFAGSLDLTYVGPNPALNAYMRSRGKEVRIIAGAAEGGSALVVQKEINAPGDLRGKKIATPQFGNTQDVACRIWLAQQGFKVTLTGGDVQVIPTPNPEQLDLFRRGAIAGVWTVEPWVSRLELQANGKVLVMEDQALTTVLAGRAGFLQKQPDLAKKFAAAHAELTQWINAHPKEAQEMARAELGAEMHSPFPENIFEHAWGRLRFKTEVSLENLEKLVAATQKAGFLKDSVPLKDLMQAP
jgi:NitT/TauT family transport system substrate-binding protein